MINATFFGINMILVAIAWKYMLKPSLLDHFRDKLFDLREDVRNFYISNNISLKDETYKNLRNIINRHLRFMEQLSLMETIYFGYKIKNTELNEHIKRTIDNKFKTNNKSLKEFIDGMRRQSIVILIHYMILSSPILLALFSFIIISDFIKLIFNVGSRTTTNISNILSGSISETSYIVKKHVVTDEGLEEISFECTA